MHGALLLGAEASAGRAGAFPLSWRGGDGEDKLEEGREECVREWRDGGRDREEDVLLLIMTAG